MTDKLMGDRLTLEDAMRLFVYRPYDYDIEFMVDDEERIYVRCDHWSVTLDHRTGDFSFTGELHKYYEMDTIESIRDCFGDIYSIFNLRYDTQVRNVWFTVTATTDIYRSEEKEEYLLYQRNKYYREHKEHILLRMKERYRKKKSKIKNEFS